MKIRYILGRSGRGKTNLILDEIKRRLEAGVDYKLILLVPEQFTLQGELDLIKKLDRDGIIDVEVLSFQRLAYKVFNEVGGLKRTGINELGKLTIFRRLLDEHSKELRIFQKSYAREGL